MSILTAVIIAVLCCVMMIAGLLYLKDACEGASRVIEDSKRGLDDELLGLEPTEDLIARIDKELRPTWKGFDHLVPLVATTDGLSCDDCEWESVDSMQGTISYSYIIRCPLHHGGSVRYELGGSR